MIVNTYFFGELEVPEENIITFTSGLMGFESQKHFVIVKNNDTEKPVPFFWLQSVDDVDLTFVLTVPFIFKQDYEFDLPEEVEKKLGIDANSEIGIYSIVTIPDKVENFHYNLLSPIVVNYSNRQAEQVVLYNENFSMHETFKKK
ncbi:MULTISPECIES: flagellar assembly protein FliW [unclassified Fusibacter]|uniref:flagellar assembly protein FliW n=1 Tax=unclassified Fusibacter TaxID=2624464 RepID=UPI001011947F|nr:MULTISPECIES: flagellar assembly protein FliW [unclassified Fusibacter]MCK8059834.1 flagellar assembly protein FliW [Fusibacter sp. A2]NPE21636.1 flagellar assembly protein FliW [Fusibacter sp. A1]RXV62040.1 flagellar assembly protein FliW [Fusibacter sp. A1]